jgi:hypothetical protein
MPKQPKYAMENQTSSSSDHPVHPGENHADRMYRMNGIWESRGAEPAPIINESGDAIDNAWGASETQEKDTRSGDVKMPREIGGRGGPEPTRYGDWEKCGRCIDF